MRPASLLQEKFGARSGKLGAGNPSLLLFHLPFKQGVQDINPIARLQPLDETPCAGVSPQPRWQIHYSPAVFPLTLPNGKNVSQSIVKGILIRGLLQRSGNGCLRLQIFPSSALDKSPRPCHNEAACTKERKKEHRKVPASPGKFLCRNQKPQPQSFNRRAKSSPYALRRMDNIWV
jgi:hypothetical protein